MNIYEISCACGGALVPLGRHGENNVTQIVFALQPFLEKYGEGSALLLHQRSKDKQPYPVAAVQEGDKLVWTVSNADTAVSGIGKAEIQWYVGDQLAKSQIYSTTVAKALEKPSENPPDPVKPWYDRLMEAIEEVKDDPEAIKQAVEDYLRENPVDVPVKSVNGETGAVQLNAADVGAVAQADLQEATEEALRIAKESGAFDGAPGAKGEKGEKGDPGEPATNLVQSVNGKQGAVVLSADDVGARTAEAQDEIDRTKITAPENPVAGKILTVKEVREDGSMVVEWGDAPQAGEIEEIKSDVAGLKDDLSWKLDNAPAQWPEWTADKQKTAQERIGIVTLTQEEYDLLETKGESTIYMIVEDAT